MVHHTSAICHFGTLTVFTLSLLHCPPRIPPRTLRSEGKNLVVQPRHRLERALVRAFSCAGPRCWNSLPAHIRYSESLNSFKSLLKLTYSNLLSKTFYESKILKLHFFSNVSCICITLLCNCCTCMLLYTLVYNARAFLKVVVSVYLTTCIYSILLACVQG